jgi:uncharacterized protein (TIGR02453 family)
MLTKNFFQFLKDLAKNNNKEWFDLNRARYESDVKKPFEDFVIILGNELNKFDSEIQGDFKKNIFRINKDIRFSKDKTPYKTNRSVAFSLNGKKDHEDPGYYLELGAEKSYIAGGAWCPSPEKLLKIRSEIYYNTEEFNKILKNKKFKDTFSDLQGERSKILPKDIKDWAADSEYIYNKQFYFYREFNNKEVSDKGFIKKISKWFSHGYEINQFLRRAMRD